MTGDLLDLLHDTIGHHPQTILAALATADEPLVATVECPTCKGEGSLEGRNIASWDACWTCTDGTVRIASVTEDVLRERLREADLMQRFTDPEWAVDAIVRAIFGGDDEA